MLRILHSRTVAVLGGALTLALASGTAGAVAAGLITSADIKNHTLARADMDQSSVGSRQIIDKAVARKDLKPHVSDLLGAEDAVGFTAYTVQEFQRTLTAGDDSGGEVGCDKGQDIIGGGVDSGDPGVIVQSSLPNPDTHDAWVYSMRNTTGSSQVITVVAICANVGAAEVRAQR
jgi:hypothetical protein